jgi:hypothetical protein
VALHACRVLQTNEKVVFATAWQLAEDTAQVRYAKADGYRVVVVPDDSFSFTFVEPRTMTAAEQAVFARTGEIATLAHVDLSRRTVAVLISETMRLNDTESPFSESGNRLNGGS